jgi:fermentation-respiration switch protein FrsA (DUF1100 family)
MLKIIFASISIYCLLLVILYFTQRSMTYFPDRSVITPSQAGVPEMEVIELATQDNLSIKAWYKAPTTPHTPTLVYFHGNAGGLAHRGFIARIFLDQGYGLFLLTYRGYSGNPGSPSEAGLYNDARAAIKFLINQDVSPECLVLIGESIGSSVAIKMATEFKVGSIILQAPFSTLTDVASIHYSFFLPYKGLIQDKYDSMAIASQIRAPILILHGKNDTIIPPELSRKLFEIMPEPKEAEYLPGRGHNDLFAPELMHRFIQKHVKCKS